MTKPSLIKMQDIEGTVYIDTHQVMAVNKIKEEYHLTRYTYEDMTKYYFLVFLKGGKELKLLFEDKEKAEEAQKRLVEDIHFYAGY